MAAGSTSRPRRPPAPAEGLFGTDRPGDLHEGIYRSLIHAIASGRYPAGGRLPSEPDLARAFSVSRPVVRQALEKLRAEGLVVSRPGSGTYVAELDALAQQHLGDLARLQVHVARMQQDLEFRLVFEPEAAHFAALRRSPEELLEMERAFDDFRAAHEAGQITHHHDFRFHQAIARAAGNPHFARASQDIEFSQDPAWLVIRPLVFFAPGPRANEVLAEHGAVLSEIRSRDPEAARAAMASHIRASRARLAQYFPA